MRDPIATLAGLRLEGTEDDTGIWWMVSGDGAISGWWSSPAPVFESAQRPRAHGVWVGESFLSGRNITISGYVGSDSFAATSRALARLSAACALEAVPLAIEEDAGLTLGAAVQRNGEVLTKWITDTVALWSIQLLAVDPRRLGSPLVGSTGLPSSSGGLTIPFTLPKAIVSTVVSGQINLFNPGNIEGPVLLRIDGPVTGPIVTHTTSGKRLVFASSLVLSAGEFITVDMTRREVLAQGQSSRNGWVTSRGWSGFEPGANTWAFTSTGGVPGGLLTVTATPAWS